MTNIIPFPRAELCLQRAAQRDHARRVEEAVMARVREVRESLKWAPVPCSGCPNRIGPYDGFRVRLNPYPPDTRRIWTVTLCSHCDPGQQTGGQA